MAKRFHSSGVSSATQRLGVGRHAAGHRWDIFSIHGNGSQLALPCVRRCTDVSRPLADLLVDGIVRSEATQALAHVDGVGGFGFKYLST